MCLPRKTSASLGSGGLLVALTCVPGPCHPLQWQIKCPLKSHGHFQIGLLVILWLSFESAFSLVKISPLSPHDLSIPSSGLWLVFLFPYGIFGGAGVLLLMLSSSTVSCGLCPGQRTVSCVSFWPCCHRRVSCIACAPFQVSGAGSPGLRGPGA